jgi:hypothetical protein
MVLGGSFAFLPLIAGMVGFRGFAIAVLLGILVVLPV